MSKQLKILSVVEVLEKIDDGGTLEELKTTLHDVVKQVRERGGKGSVTLKLIVEKKGRNRLDITDTIACSIPRRPSEPSTFFATDDGRLTRDNPEQYRLIEDPDANLAED